MLRLLRSAFFLVGASVLLWLSSENQDARLALLFGALLSILLALRVTVRADLTCLSPLITAGIGGLVGLSTPLLAALLMLLKIGLHSHPTPDFSLSQVIDVLERAPFFLAGGLLLGLGIGWFWRTRDSSA